MRKILLYEFNYHKNTLFILYIIIPIVFILQKLDKSDSHNILMTLLLFFLLNKMLRIGKQEKRDRQILLFPIPIIHIAFSRILQIIIPCLIVYSEILILGCLLKVYIVYNFLEIIYSFSFVLLFSGLYFISNDIKVHFSKKMNIIIKSFFIVIPVLALYAGLILLFLFNNPNGPDKVIRDFMNVIQEHNPFSDLYGSLRFVLISVCLLLFSILTFMNRKVYRE